MPGSGALLAAVATASGVVPEVAGKPNPPMVDYIRSSPPGPSGGSPVMVGDQPGTDGLLAERLGIPFALVDSGVTPPGAPVDGVPGGRPGPRPRHPGGPGPGLAAEGRGRRVVAERCLSACYRLSTPGRMGPWLTNDSIQRYLDAGIAFTHMTRQEGRGARHRAGPERRPPARRGQGARSTSSSSGAGRAPRSSSSAVRSEVSRQLGPWASPTWRTWPARWPSCWAGPRPPARRRPAQEGPGQEGAGQEDCRQEGDRRKKAPAKKTAAKKTPAKKAAAKKAPAKKAPPRRRRPRRPPPRDRANDGPAG